MKKQLLISLRIMLVLLVITCVVYPLVVWAAAQAFFPRQANGSLVKDAAGKIVGSSLLAQGFTSPWYFHPRPSAAGSGYDPTQSGGTNLGPASRKLIYGAAGFEGAGQLAADYRRENNLAPGIKVPVDAVTRSASGLDPDISLANCLLQAVRVAQARHIPLAQVSRLIRQYTHSPSLGFLNAPYVNVLRLNLVLDKQYPLHP